MREQILQMLDFPRSLVRDNIDLEKCTHAGNFAPHDPICAKCASQLECSWLFHNDEFSGLGKKSITQLAGALEFALGYVGALSFRAGHRPRKGCSCQVCAWLDGAYELHQEIKRPA